MRCGAFSPSCLLSAFESAAQINEMAPHSLWTAAASMRAEVTNAVWRPRRVAAHPAASCLNVSPALGKRRAGEPVAVQAFDKSEAMPRYMIFFDEQSQQHVPVHLDVVNATAAFLDHEAFYRT